MVTDPAVFARLENAWKQRVTVTWITPTRADSAVEVTQVLRDGGTRVLWFQPGLMWYEGKAYAGDPVIEVWPDIAIRCLTPQAFLQMLEKADEVRLVAADYPRLAPVTLNPAGAAALKSILSSVDGFENADEEYPSGCRPGAPWYELRYHVGGKSYTLWIMDQSDRAVLPDLWGFSPMALFKAAGLYSWASEILPIPAYADTEIESLYSVPNAVLLNGPVSDRTIDAWILRSVVSEMLTALPPGSADYPSDPPSGEAPYTLDVGRGRETIPVWDDWFFFAGKMYYYKGFRQVVERAQ
ncbi:MAG TPA: hypothetical protein VGL40_00825 [Bacillota bacterium]